MVLPCGAASFLPRGFSQIPPSLRASSGVFLTQVSAWRRFMPPPPRQRDQLVGLKACVTKAKPPMWLEAIGMKRSPGGRQRIRRQKGSGQRVQIICGFRQNEESSGQRGCAAERCNNMETERLRGTVRPSCATHAASATHVIDPRPTSMPPTLL